MRALSTASLTLILLGSISIVCAQQATEVFIPIGQSPGLSDKYTYMGTVESVNKQKQTIRADGRDIEIVGDTEIWLDRTALKERNSSGSFADLQSGRQVEIKYVDATGKQVADWIKIKVTQP